MTALRRFLLCTILGVHAFGPVTTTRTGMTWIRARTRFGRRIPQRDVILYGQRGWRRTCRLCDLEQRDPLVIRDRTVR